MKDKIRYHKGLAALLVLTLSFSIVPEIQTKAADDSGIQPLSIEDGIVELKPTREIRYIDRVELPEFAFTLYETLEEAIDGDGEKDYLIDDKYFDLSEEDISSDKPGDFIRGNLRSSSTGIIVRYTAIQVTSIETAANDENTKAYIYDCINTVYAAFLRDHPEVFWLSGSKSNMCYSWGGKIYYCFALSSSSTSGTYDKRLPEFRLDGDLDILEVMAERDVNVQRILRTIPAGADRFTQIFYLNKWLTENNEYNTIVADGLASGLSSADIDRPWDSTQCVSALAGQEGGIGPECGAYAQAFKVLCDALGIPCVHVRSNHMPHSDGSEGRHSWNYVQMEDDQWYAVDVTWNDPLGGNAGKLSGRETTKYLLIGGKTVINSKGLEFLVSHPAENPFYADGTTFPNGPVLSDSAYDSGAHLCYDGLPERLSPGDFIAMTPVLICGSNTDYIYNSNIALPAGLMLNPNTGEITGTVTDEIDALTVTILAINSSDPADCAECTLKFPAVADNLWSNSNLDTSTSTSTQATVPIPEIIQKRQLNILGIMLDKFEMELEVEDKGFLKARVLFDDWNAEDEEMDWVTKEEKEVIEREIKWFSEDPKVAKVAWRSNNNDNTLALVTAKSVGQTKIYAWIEADGLAYLNSNRPTAGDYIAEATITIVDSEYEIKFRDMNFATGRNYDLKDYVYLQYGEEENVRNVDLKDSAEQVVFSNAIIIEGTNENKNTGLKLSDDGILNMNASKSKLVAGNTISFDIATSSGKSGRGIITIVEANNVKKITFKGDKGTKEVFDMGSEDDYHREVVDDKTNKVISEAEISKEIGGSPKAENEATGNNAYLSIEWQYNEEEKVPTDDFTWTSSNPNVVVVESKSNEHTFNKGKSTYASDAKLTAKNVGNSKITVTSASGKKAVLTVTVTATPDNIKINGVDENNKLLKSAWSGKVITLTATMYGKNGMALPATATKLNWKTTETDSKLKKNAKVSTNKDNTGRVLPANVLSDTRGNIPEQATYNVQVATKAKFGTGSTKKNIESKTVGVTLKQSNIADITIDELQQIKDVEENVISSDRLAIIGRLPQTKSDLRKLFVGKNTYKYEAMAYVPEGQKIVSASATTDKKDIADSIAWSVKNTKVVTVDDKGNLVAVGPGKTDVTASYVSLKYTGSKAKASVRKKTISVQVIQKATAISFAKEVQVINPSPKTPKKEISATFTIKNVLPKKAAYNVTDWKVIGYANGKELNKLTDFSLDGSKTSDAIRVDSRDNNGNLKKAVKITIPAKYQVEGTVIKVGAYTDGGAVAYGYLYITSKTTKITAELTGDKVKKEGNNVSIKVGDTANIKAYINDSPDSTISWKIIKDTTDLGKITPNTYVTEPVTYSLDKNSAKLIRVDSNGKVTALKNGKAKVIVSTLSSKKTTVSFEVEEDETIVGFSSGLNEAVKNKIW